MRSKLIRRLVVVFAAPILFISAGVFAAPFTPGDLAVFQADNAGTSNTSMSIVEVALSPSVNGVQTFSINGTTNPDAMRASGSASSTGYLSLTNDRTLIAFDVANSSLTTGNTNTVLTRAVGALDQNGNFTKPATYTGSSGNQPRSATSLNNTNWFIGDQNGMYTNNASSASPSGNFRAAKTFGGNVYELTTTSTAVVVGTLATPSGATYTGLAGLPNGDSSSQDYYFISSGSNGSAFDELYILQDSSSTAGTVEKFSLVSGSWVANGTAATAFGGFGMAAARDGAGADLYITSGTGATGANSVVKVIDSGGYNQTISLGTPLTLLTAATGETFKGIDFVPVPEPTTLALGALVLPMLASRRRRV